MMAPVSRRSGQRGMVLVASLLLLVVVTILAVGLFRSFGIDEKIAGNTRDKQLALNAAESAEQYAEWWLSTGGNGAGITVTTTCAAFVPASTGQVCLNALPAPATLPWTLGVNYTLPPVGPAQLFTTMAQPYFYIQKLGKNAQGDVYQIDAAGFGGSLNTVAVVESTFLCAQKSTSYMNPGNGGSAAGSIC
jgi:type IV pilus assembly protein PilX